MKIEEAIADLQARVDGEFCIEGVDTCEDMKLGIEALKFVEDTRTTPIHDLPPLLPGETEE